MTSAVDSKKVWAQGYHECLANPPKANDILLPFESELARLDLELYDGRDPFIYARVYVPSIVGCTLGWFLQPLEKNDSYGMKCILLPRSREAYIREYGLLQKVNSVRALRVVRASYSNNSLLCELVTPTT